MYQPFIPWDEIRELPLPNLALRVLASQADNSSPNINNILRGMDMALGEASQPDGDRLLERVADAWAWLEAHALIGPHPRNTASEWQRVTASGRSLVNDPKAVTKIWAADRLSGLDPLLSPAYTNFSLGDFETACFAAMKAVEVEVRRVAGLPNEAIGVNLMRRAFKPEGGPLVDPGAEGGEQQATADLFAGAMGVFKNPASHRAVEFDDAAEAAEIVQLADLLLKIIRRAERRLQS